MKNLYDEMNKLTMADEDDYDEYEEEVIERDEEYDDGDEYDDEEYEEEYDDEEYEDEEPYDEEEYEEEPYDDGYDDQYYDDRLNQVLDELAELKRNMNQQPAVVQPQQPYPAIQPHLLFSVPQQNGNEVVMYNEISRLRDELSKTQNEQSMHVELTRLKEEMEREKRQNETQFLSEIKRLNERIEELQQPESAKRAALPAGAPATALLPEAPQVSSKEINKLVNINESLLRSTRDSDAHILSDIAALKSKLDTMGASDELMAKLNEIRSAVATLESRPVHDHADLMNEVSATVAGLKAAYEESAAAIKESIAAAPAATTNAGSAVDQKLLHKLSRLKMENGGVDLTEIMRSVYELKGMVGSNDPNQQNLVNMALKAYTDLDLLHVTVANSTDFRAKLEAVENFVASVNAQDFITSDALSAYNIVLTELMNTPVDRSVFDAVCSFGAATGKVTVPSAKKDAVYKCISFAERIKREDIDAALEFLPDMIAARNDAEGSKNVTVNAGLYDDILSADAERKAAVSESAKFSAEHEIKALLSELSDLRVGDVVVYAPVMPLPTSDAMHFEDGDSVSDRLNSLINAVDELSEAVASVANDPKTLGYHGDDGVAATAQAEPVQTVSDGSVEGSLDNLKSMLYALNAKVDLEGLATDVRTNFAAVSDRLAAIESRINEQFVREEPVVVEREYGAEPIDAVEVQPDITAQTDEIVDRINERLETADGENRSVMLAALDEIKEKLAAQETLLAQIDEVRADLAALPESVNSTAQFDKLYDDIAAQFDKLYEDLSAVEGDTAEKLTEQLAEIKAEMDGLVSSELLSAILDGIVDFRTAYEESQALTASDREKILADIAYVRDGVATQLESNVSEQVESLKAEFDEKMSLLETQIAALPTLDAVAEQYTVMGDAVAENAQLILDGQQPMLAALEELKEKSAAIEEAVNANGMLVAENQTTVSEELGRLAEMFAPPEGTESTNIYDEILSISARVNEIYSVYEKAGGEIKSSLAEIKEQVHLKELEQSLAAVSATEEEQQTLLTEIAALRERLSGLESAQQEQADASAAQSALIAEKVETLCAALSFDEADAVRSSVESLDARMTEAGERDAANAANMEAILGDVAEIKEKLFRGATDDAALNMQVLMADVADIKDRLNMGADASSDIVKMQDDLTFIRNQIEANMDDGSDMDSINATLENEDMSLLMDDIAAIKEKLASFDEYDTVAEILSLREDVKSARILDTNDVANELEGLKGDLLELKADVSDIKAGRTDADSIVSAGVTPTSDEVNMLLSEIVSLRDEIQSYKDDVANMVASQGEGGEPQPSIAVADENISVILDELTGLHSDIAEVREETLAEQANEIEDIKAALSEIKDMISRRTTLAEDGAARDTAVSNELNVVLDEIINVKDEVAALKTDFSAANETVAAARESDAQAEKAAFADELQAFKNELYSVIGEKLAEVSAPDLHEEMQSIRDQLIDLQALAVNGVLSDDTATHKTMSEELREIKAMLESGNVQSNDTVPAVTVSELFDEVAALRQEIQARSVQPIVDESGDVTVDLTPVVSQVAALREQIETMSVSAESEPDTAVLGEVLSLREEIAALREQMNTAPASAESEPDTVVLGEVLSLREEIAALREQMDSAPVAESENEAVLGEVLALREEIERMRESNVSEETAGIMEAVDAIKEDVRSIKEEPDLGIINEVLALRDEFQAFKDELNKTRTAPQEDKSKEELIAEVQSLRDQLFAISMANVNDGTNGDVVYESYNNIILDEISSLRDEIALIKQADETRELSEELSDMKDKLTNIAVDDSEKTEARFGELRAELAALKQSASQDANAEVLQEIASLKAELANRQDAEKASAEILDELAQLKAELADRKETEKANAEILNELSLLKAELADRKDAEKANAEIFDGLESLRAEMRNRKDADATTMNFVAEIAKMLETRFAENSGAVSDERLNERIESLKAEIAASLSASAATPGVSSYELRDEIESLREALDRNLGEPVTIDNSAILEEISALREEMERQNTVSDSKKILNEISKLKDELVTIADSRSAGEDGTLSQSINDLKAELNQIAEFVEEEEKPKAPAKKKATASRSKSGNKGGRKKSSANKTATATANQEESGLSGDELISKIESVRFSMPEVSEGMLVMNPEERGVQEPIPPTSEEMDIAARLAKQVANKLIMEQLVQQLGDGGVPHSEVEEIVKDILPQEFTTIQIDEQTDRVRRLANSLVLDKLRARLKK